MPGPWQRFTSAVGGWFGNAPTEVATPDPVAAPDEDPDDYETTPPKGKYTELPVFGVPPPDRAYIVDSVLNSLERGQFRDAALMVDSMMRDDRVSGVLDTRIDALIGSPLDFDPAGESDEEQEIADQVGDLWPTIMSSGARRELHKWNIMCGVGVGELVWPDRRVDQWVPRLKVWHNQFLWWHWGERRFYLITAEGNIPITPGDGRWVVLASKGYERAWLNGKLRCLGKPWMIRQWTYRDWARWCEIHGQPIRKLITPAEADERKKKALLGQLANIANETVIAVPQGEEPGNKWDIALVEAAALGYQGFDMLLSKTENSIAISLIGQNLTTEVKQGSRAAAQVHDNVRGDIRQADAQGEADCSREHILEPLCAYNYGDPELAPYPMPQIDPPPSEEQKSDVLLKIAQAVTALDQVGVDVRAVCEAYDLPLREEGAEPLITPPPAPTGKPPSPGEKKTFKAHSRRIRQSYKRSQFYTR